MSANYDTMQKTLQSLNQALFETSIWVGDKKLGAILIGAGPSVDAWEGVLDGVRQGIGQLAGVQFMEVVGGVRTEESWMAYASELYAALRSVKADLPYWSAGGVAQATAEATAQDAAKVALTGAAILTPILLLVGGLYLLVIFGPMLRGGS